MNELHRDPPRWQETGYLSEELTRELAAYGAEAPGAASKLRMLEQLSTQLEVSAPLVAKPVALVKLKLVFVASVILAGAVGLMQFAPPVATVMHAREPAPSATTRLAPLAATTLAPEPQVEALIETPVVATRVVEAPVVAAPVVARAPRLVAQRGVAAAGVRPEPAQEVPVTATAKPDVLAELTMLARARRALLNDPARALELSEEHARSYPRGTFDEEREVLAIESLLKLGRQELARARARAFEIKFPRSAQNAHLAKLIANPSE